MGDLSDFQRALLVGATVPETAQLLEISRSTISKIMTADEKVGKTSSAQHKSSRSSSLFKRDRRILNRNVRKDKTTASKITAELNEHLERPVSTKNRVRNLQVIKQKKCLISFST